MSQTTDDIERIIIARLAGTPGGLTPRALLADLPAPQAQVALGLLVVRGNVDEAAGRLALTRMEHRRAS